MTGKYISVKWRRISNWKSEIEIKLEEEMKSFKADMEKFKKSPIRGIATIASGFYFEDD